MSTETAITVFIAIAALALVFQGIALWGIRNSMRTASTRIDTVSADLQKEIEVFTAGLSELLEILKPLAQNIQTIQQHVAATTETVHKRVKDLDGFLQDSTDAARLQIARIQDLVETVSKQVEETFYIIQKGLLTPVTEASAIVRGVKVGLEIFLRGRQRPTHASHQDEEMFI